MSFTSKAEKSIIHGATSAIGAVIVGGYRTRVLIPFFESDCPLWCIGAGAGIITSMANDFIHDYILPDIPVNQKVKSESAMVLGVALSGLIFTGSLYAVNPHLPMEFGVLNALGVGAGAEVVAGYTLDILRGSGAGY